MNSADATVLMGGETGSSNESIYLSSSKKPKDFNFKLVQNRLRRFFLAYGVQIIDLWKRIENDRNFLKLLQIRGGRLDQFAMLKNSNKLEVPENYNFFRN